MTVILQHQCHIGLMLGEIRLGGLTRQSARLLQLFLGQQGIAHPIKDRIEILIQPVEQIGTLL